MENDQISPEDILIETHIGLERQGPGSPEMTMTALGFLDNVSGFSRVADLGCGTGGQTMLLAQNIPGHITGVDICPEFIDVFNDNARKLNLQDRVHGVVGSIEDLSIEELSFQKKALDLIWSEGVIDSIGFKKGLRHWRRFLKKNGSIVVSCPSWIADGHPAEIEEFWTNADSGLDTVAHNISVMQKTGFSFVASFTLPEKCWTDNYFIPRAAAEKALLEKYKGNKTVAAYIEDEKYEAALYSKYKQYYGYVFYIGKKI